jgi:hypothetical protein
MLYLAGTFFLLLGVTSYWVRVLQKPNPFGNSGQKRFSTVEGMITKVDIGEVVTNGNIIYSPLIEYEFFIESRKYIGNRIGAVVPSFGNSDRSFTQRFLSNYEAGQKVNVHFNILEPEDCYLVEKVPVNTLQPAIFIIFGVAGLGMLLFGLSQIT